MSHISNIGLTVCEQISPRSLDQVALARPDLRFREKKPAFLPVYCQRCRTLLKVWFTKTAGARRRDRTGAMAPENVSSHGNARYLLT